MYLALAKRFGITAPDLRGLMELLEEFFGEVKMSFKSPYPLQVRKPTEPTPFFTVAVLHKQLATVDYPSLLPTLSYTMPFAGREL